MNIDKNFTDLLNYLVEPKALDHGGGKTICYLTFPNSRIQYVKQKLNDGWLDIVRHKGLSPVVLSIHKVLKDFFQTDDYRIEVGKDASDSEDEMRELFDSLGNNLKEQEIIENAILSKQEDIKEIVNGVLVITDLEAIHPYTRFGPIEQKIYNRIEVPIIVMYPGEMTGSALKFLEFYPEDGNYRSKHF
ncbi:BREX protein BrxB domain-containing protein [Kaistella sp.]|uniref:BREX protein BrxB domain-containing protein n=1 Tax=Kaistella sp. TaxID=2782235 RepID=UPI00359F3AB3